MTKLQGLAKRGELPHTTARLQDTIEWVCDPDRHCVIAQMNACLTWESRFVVTALHAQKRSFNRRVSRGALLIRDDEPLNCCFRSWDKRVVWAPPELRDL